MKKEGKNWLFTTMVTLLLLLSIIPLITNTVSAAGTFEGIETYNGICGQKIWLNSSGWDGGSDREYVQIWFAPNYTGWGSGENANDDDDYIKRVRADSDGEVNVSFNIPYRSMPEEYNVSMYGEDDYEWVNFSMIITDIYKVTTDPEIIYWDDTVAQDIVINVYNWTGSSYSLLKESVRYILSDPDGVHLLNDTMNTGTIDTDAMFDWNDTGCLYCGESNYTLNITSSEAPYTLNASIWVPVRFHLIDFEPTTATYNDEETIKGRFIDGGDDYVSGFEYVDVVAPDGKNYYAPVITSSTGRFSIAVTFDQSGTWYVGTNITGTAYRPTDEDTTRGVEGFIWYETIEIGPQTGTITVDPDEEVYGFNVSFDIYCEDHEGDPMTPGLDTYVYVTGVDCVFDGDGYDEDDYVELGHTNDGWLNISATSVGDRLKFNNSGKATFLFTYDDEWDVYDADDDLEPLIFAETDVDITSPKAMNVFIDYGGNDSVLLGDFNNDIWPSEPPESGNIDPEEWGNWSSYFNVTVYGKTDEKMKNATILITGCGLDIEIEEDDDEKVAWGMYNFTISPRKGGILSVTVTNGSLSAIEDIEIEGLDADATTSVGDDRKITVEENETIYFTTNTHYAEVHANLYNTDWTWNQHLNWTVGDNTEGNGKDGVYEFYPDVEEMGYIVISAMEGYNNTRFYSYDIVEVTPNYDLVITIIEPEAANQTLTAGLEYDIIVELTNLTGYELDYADVDDLYAELLDWEDEVVETETFDHDEDNIWILEDYMPCCNGTLLITVKAFEEKHEGNNSDIDVDWALFEYMPSGLTAGIDLEDVIIEVYAYDALGNIIPEEDFEMVNATDYDDCEDVWSGNSTGTQTLDEDGMGLLWMDYVGNCTGYYYAELNGVNTSGKLMINYPVFDIDPPVIYVGIVSDVWFTAYDLDGNVLEGINVTVTPSLTGILSAVPDPRETNEDGMVMLTLEAEASGTVNVTLARNLHYDDGVLDWTNLNTNSTIEVTSKKPMEITVSQSPVFEGDLLTVTVQSEGDPVQDASVQFGLITQTTDSDGETIFTVPNPGVESAVYNIKAEKMGYITDSLSITVIKVWGITITGPSEAPSPGEQFTVTIIAKGSPLAGATLTFDGKTYSSGGDGKVTITAPEVDEDTEYTLTASFDPYMDGILTITIKPGGIPGFELVALIAAIGIALILFRRRK